MPLRLLATENKKAHKNGIHKPKRHLKQSQKGVCICSTTSRALYLFRVLALCDAPCSGRYCGHRLLLLLTTYRLRSSSSLQETALLSMLASIRVSMHIDEMLFLSFAHVLRRWTPSSCATSDSPTRAPARPSSLLPRRRRSKHPCMIE